MALTGMRALAATKTVIDSRRKIDSRSGKDSRTQKLQRKGVSDIFSSPLRLFIIEIGRYSKLSLFRSPIWKKKIIIINFHTRFLENPLLPTAFQITPSHKRYIFEIVIDSANIISNPSSIKDEFSTLSHQGMLNI